MAGLAAGLSALLQWQWRAYWRRVLRGGTAARSNLVVLGLIAAAGLARYVTLLRDVAKQTAAGNTSLLELVLAGLLLLTLLPVWDSAGLALGSRDMARFPVTPGARFGLRALSRFIAPLSWVLTLAYVAGLWPLVKLPHPILAIACYALLMLAGFAAGLALADVSQTAKGASATRVIWFILAIAAAAAWWAGVRSIPPMPSRLVIAAGAGNWLVVLLCGVLAALAMYAAWQSLSWMLRHAPPSERSGQAPSAARMTLLRRELRLQARLTEVRTAWIITAALAFYLITAEHPEPDALRVMFGVLAFLSVAVAMNSFGPDGVPGLDRFLVWPVQATRILAEKNKAFALAMGAPSVPLACLAAWRFGWREGAADILEAAAITLAVLAWGNITSVRHPENHESASGGNVLDQFVALAVLGLPTAASIAAMRANSGTAPFYVLGIAGAFSLAYVASLRWSASYFARRYEQMRQALT